MQITLSEVALEVDNFFGRNPGHRIFFFLIAISLILPESVVTKILLFGKTFFANIMVCSIKVLFFILSIFLFLSLTNFFLLE